MMTYITVILIYEKVQSFALTYRYYNTEDSLYRPFLDDITLANVKIYYSIEFLPTRFLVFFCFLIFLALIISVRTSTGIGKSPV